MSAQCDITKRHLANYAPTTTAVQIASANRRLDFREIINVGTVSIFIGPDSTVTATGATRGTELPIGGQVYYDLSNGDVWAITASGTGDVHVNAIYVD